MKHEDAAKRLKTVEGHVAGIRRMLEEDAYCIDVIRQIQAVQAALNKVGKIVLDENPNSESLRRSLAPLHLSVHLLLSVPSVSLW